MLFKGNGSKENIPSINSSGNALFVNFTSDGNVSESGFRATYSTNRVGKKKFLLITCRHTINLFIFAITTYRLIWRWMMVFFLLTIVLPALLCITVYDYTFDNIFKLSGLLTYFGVYWWKDDTIKDS